MLTLNPNHYVHSATDATAYPHFADAKDIEALKQFDHILWVQHAVSGIWWPWLAAGEIIEYLAVLDKGLNTLTEQQTKFGIDLGLLYDVALVNIERSAFQARLVLSRKKVEAQGYCKLSSITFPTYYNTVNYWTQTVESQLVRDTQVARRVNMHNAALFRVIHRQLTALVAQVVTEAIKPSYCYLSKYEPGAVLEKHVDRPQCRWNASVQFARTDKIWPIYVERNGESIEILADLGEVVIYQGSELPHWRDALPMGTATICFFHFVAQDFQGTLD